MLHICSLGKHKTFLYHDPTWSGGHKFDCWNSILPNIRSFEKSFFLSILSIKGTVFAVEMLFEKPKFYRIDKLPFHISTVYDLFNTMGIIHTLHPLFNHSVYTKYSYYMMFHWNASLTLLSSNFFEPISTPINQV